MRGTSTKHLSSLKYPKIAHLLQFQQHEPLASVFWEQGREGCCEFSFFFLSTLPFPSRKQDSVVFFMMTTWSGTPLNKEMCVLFCSV